MSANPYLLQEEVQTFTAMSEDEIQQRIIAAKAALGERLIILGHHYQREETFVHADVSGDSLKLSRSAANSRAEYIVFCGVHFMAETAKILNPDKIVILPDLEAGCSLADSAPADKFRKWANAHPDHTIISYINCTAEVKAMSDIICTSSNAAKIIESIPDDEKICFAPDKYLGRHIIKQTGRDMVLWDGTCQVHQEFSEIAVVNLMNKHPKALVLAHPECPENILNYADEIGSTSKIINFATHSDYKEFIILTEPGVIHQMKKLAPGKVYIPVPNLEGCSCNECPYMRLNTLEKMANALETLEPQIILDEEIRKRAEKPLLRMLELS